MIGIKSHSFLTNFYDLNINGNIILETDAPDMTGHTHKGERNSPEYLVDALNSLAELKSIDVELIAEQTTNNAEALFNI